MSNLVKFFESKNYFLEEKITSILSFDVCSEVCSEVENFVDGFVDFVYLTDDVVDWSVVDGWVLVR